MTPAAGVPWRPLAALTAAVLGAHWLALRGVPAVVSWIPPPVVVHTTVPAPVAAVAPVDARPVAAEPGEARATAAPPAPSPPRAAAPPPTSRAPPRNAPLARRPPAPATADTPATPVGVQPGPATPVPPFQLPPAGRWHYATTVLRRGVPMPGRAQLDWQPSQDGYEAVLAVTIPGLPDRVQRSAGALTPRGLEPLRYADRVRSEQATHFDRAAGRIVFSSNRPDAPLQAGAQDRLSALLQLAGTVAADPARFVPGTVLAMQTAGTREAERWDYTVDGPDDLALPGGVVPALKLTRAPQREYDVRLEVWLGPGPDYALVRLRLTPPNGDWLDLQWSGTDRR